MVQYIYLYHERMMNMSDKRRKNSKAVATFAFALSIAAAQVTAVSAAAETAGVRLDLDTIEEVSRRTPNLTRLSPSGPDHIQDLLQSGGIYGVMDELSKKGLLDLEAKTVYDRPMGELIKGKYNGGIVTFLFQNFRFA